MWNFVKEKGYEYDGVFYNKNYNRLCKPTEECFEEVKYYQPAMLTKSNLKRSGGVNGMFFAAVYSPKYFNFHDGKQTTHAVVCDTDMNIVHDPNPAYKNIREYPLAKLLKNNGILYVYDFKKIK